MKTELNRRAFVTVAAASALPFPMIARAQERKKIRYAWMNTVSVAAQVTHTLMRTDIADRHGLDIEYIQLPGTPAVNEALVGGAADVGGVSDFGAVTLMAVGAPVVPVAYQSAFRSGILALNGSGIKTLADLKGKKVYGLFGITAYMNAQEAVRGSGLTIGKDVQFVNIGVSELSDAVRAKKIDAFFTWDPWIPMYVSSGMATPISENTTPSMILQASKKYIAANSPALRSFLQCHTEAMFYAATHQEQANQWFQSVEPASKIPLDVIQTSSLADPQWSAKRIADLRLGLNERDLASMERMAEWGVREKLLPRKPDVRALVHNQLALSVDKEVQAAGFVAPKVTVKRA